MARALHEHLGIRAEVLLQELGASLTDPLAGIEWNRFPVKAMAKLGWIPNVKKLELRAEVNLARVLQVHPAIVAGKIRHEEKDYRLLSHFVGTGEVRRHFATLVARDTRRDATSAE